MKKNFRKKIAKRFENDNTKYDICYNILFIKILMIIVVFIPLDICLFIIHKPNSVLHIYCIWWLTDRVFIVSFQTLQPRERMPRSVPSWTMLKKLDLMSRETSLTWLLLPRFLSTVNKYLLNILWISTTFILLTCPSCFLSLSDHILTIYDPFLTLLALF